MSNHRVETVFTLERDQFDRELNQASNSVREFGNEVRDSTKTAADQLKSAGESMTKTGKTLSTKVTAPIVGVGAAAVHTAAKFEDSMSKVQALSGATEQELKSLSNMAKELGSTTAHSASDAADAMGYLALAGWKTNEILSATPQMLALASAGSMDLARAADIVTDTMSAFGMSADEAGIAADVFAYAQANANTSVEQLGESLKYAAPIAKEFGADLEQTTAVLGFMANAGIKGSQAGTALRSGFTRLAAPTSQATKALKELNTSVTDVDGNMRDISAIIADLETGLEGMSEEQRLEKIKTIFGQEGMGAWAAVIGQGSDALIGFTNDLYNSEGAAEKMADMMEDNLGGSIRAMKSAIEGLLITIGEQLAPMIKTAAEYIGDLARRFSNLSEGQQQAIIKFGLFAAAVGPVLLILGSLAGAISKIIVLGKGIAVFAAGLKGATVVAGGASVALGATGAAAGGLGAKLAILAGPVGWAALAVAGLAVAAWDVAKVLRKDAIPAVDLFGEGVSKTTKEAVGSFMDLDREATLALKQLSWSAGEVSKEMADSIAGNFKEMGDKVLAELDSYHNEALSSMQEFLMNSKDLTAEEQQEILETMQNGHEDRKKAIEEGQIRIKEIMELASQENRALKESEQLEINAIQRTMRDTGIQVLSESEIEANLIMQRMKDQAEALSTEQATVIVQNSIQQKEGAIKAAEEQYEGVLREIIRQRDEAGSITKAQADKLIEEAARQRDHTVGIAKDMHTKVITEAKKQAETHVDYINWETGEVKSRWTLMWEGIRVETDKGTASIRERFANFSVNLAASAIGWGKSVWEGFTSGMSGQERAAQRAAKDMASSIDKEVTGYFDIRSPSRLFKKYGGNLVDGITEGIYLNTSHAVTSVRSMMDHMVYEVEGGVSKVNSMFDHLRGSEAFKDSMDLSQWTKTITPMGKAESRTAPGMDKAYSQYDEYLRRRLQAEEQAAATNRNFEEVIFDQSMRMRDKSQEALLDHMDFIDHIKDSYILTTDEMIMYTQQQFELSLSLRDNLASDMKRRMEKELDQLRVDKSKEIDIIRNANAQEVEALRRKMNAIDAVMRENSYAWSKEDLDKEIANLESELQKYLYATSFEGIQTRNRIEEELSKKREEKKRNGITKELQDQKQAHQDEIDQRERNTNNVIAIIENQMDESERIYKQKYDDLQDLFEDKENLIGNIREMALKETNNQLRAEMEQFLIDYENALGRMEQSTMSMRQLQNWRINDAKRDWEEGHNFGNDDRKESAHWDAEDARRNGGTIGSDDPLRDGSHFDGIKEVLNPDYLRVKDLGQQWANINNGKRAEDEDGLKRQEMLHQEANRIRAKYGLKYPENPPKTIHPDWYNAGIGPGFGSGSGSGGLDGWNTTPRFHTGGVVKDYLSDDNGEVKALLEPGEVIFTERRFHELMGLLDAVNLTRMLPSIESVAPSTVINNTETHNGPLIQIDTVNNSSNTDVRRFSQEMEVLASRKSRAKGIRNL